MDIEDVSSWPAMQREAEGQDARKTWLAPSPAAPHDEWWLWKPSLPTKGSAERRLTHIAEYATAQLARIMGLPVAECRLATRDGEIGILSHNFCPPPFSLTHGAALLPQRKHQRLRDIEEALTAVAAPVSCPGLSAFDVFAGYLVLDAWVANTDRHERNWAVLEDLDGAHVLAPTFDHGSALGSGLTDARRESRSIPDFCSGGKATRYEDAGSLLDLAQSALERCDSLPWAERVASTRREEWQAILDSSEGLSQVARTFIDNVLATNQERVSELCRP